MTPGGILLTALFSIMTFVLPGSNALLGLLGGICYVSQYQVVNLGGFHMHAIRMVLLVALVRAMSNGQLSAIRFNTIDKNFLVYCLVYSGVFVVREGFTGEAIVGQLGEQYNLLMSYFVFRALIPRYEDFEEFLRKAAIFIVPMAILMNLEALSGRSLLTGIGDEFRSGHYRCQGAFRSPITAGTFGATLVPLFFGLWFTTGRRAVAIIGICAATDIVVCSGSSGPLLAFGSALLGLLFWRWRSSLSKFRRGFVVTLVALHLYMNAPVWFLMGRISDIVGGGGYHRAAIVDSAVKNFGSWWFWGTNATNDWVATQLSFGGADLTNQFVVQGVHAGLAALLLFIWVLVRCFRNIGRALDKTAEEFPEVARMLWAMGVALTATVVNFFSVSYMDQIQVLMLLLLAAIVSVTTAIGVEDVPVNSGALAPEVEDSNVADRPVSGQDIPLV